MPTDDQFLHARATLHAAPGDHMMIIMIIARLSTLMLIVTMLAAGSGLDELRNVRVGQEVPSFEVSTLSGGTLKSEQLRGKVLVLVYVAAEQRSSEGAAADAELIARELRGQDLAVVSLTADVARTAFFREQRERLEINHPLGLDVGRQVYGALGVFVLPTTIIIDRGGRLARAISSYKPGHEHVLRSCVQHTLGLIDDAELEKQLSFKQISRGRPEDRIARHRAAARRLRENRLYAEAENELRLALEIDPRDAETVLDLASLFLVQQRLDEASDLLGRVPEHRRTKLMSGILLFRRGRLEEAERVLTEALLLNPDPVRTHYYLGLVAEQRGDQAGAIGHFKESLRRLLGEPPE